MWTDSGNMSVRRKLEPHVAALEHQARLRLGPLLAELRSLRIPPSLACSLELGEVRNLVANAAVDRKWVRSIVGEPPLGGDLELEWVEAGDVLGDKEARGDECSVNVNTGRRRRDLVIKFWCSRIETHSEVSPPVLEALRKSPLRRC